MSNEVYAFALKNTLKEIKNVCPDVTNTFIFTEDAKILAKDEDTTQKNIDKTVNAFNDITERADTIGGVESITIQGTEGRVNIAHMNDFYLTTVSSKEADEKYVNALTRVLIPTVIKLVDEIHPASTNDETLEAEQAEPEEENIEEEAAEADEEDTEEATEAEDLEQEDPQEEQATIEEVEEPEEAEAEPNEPIEEEQPEENIEENGLLIPEPPVTQLIIENLGGLLVPSDTVRIDNSIITQWNDLYGDKSIQEVDLEALNGKTTRCKFKNIKDSKYQGKGVIQMPEKLQLTLETTKGELVMVKPVIE